MHKADDFMLDADQELLAARFEKKRLRWEKSRRHGRALYLLMRCIFPIVTFNCLWAVFLYFASVHISGVHLLYVLIFSTILSAIFGLWEWHRNEKTYRRP